MGCFGRVTSGRWPGLPGKRGGARLLAGVASWGALAFDYELVDARDCGVMLVEQRMRGRSSGIEVPVARYAQVATFRNGLMVHWKFYASHSEALEAVGGSE